jgi:Zn-dependent metalloprotease
VPAGFNLTPGALVCNGNTARAGVGRDAAQKIWYLALRTRMTSTTNYAGAALARDAHARPIEKKRPAEASRPSVHATAAASGYTFS